jgi:hypothetical protein
VRFPPQTAELTFISGERVRQRGILVFMTKITLLIPFLQVTTKNGGFVETPKRNHQACNEVTDAAVLPPGYAKAAGRISDRRIVLAGYRLANVLKRITGN